jgi:AcrR family transcriptional regulator
MARTKNQTRRREHLIDSAIAAVGVHGLRSLSLADVARQAGLTRGAVLYYYDDLDSLLVAAYEYGMRAFLQERADLIEQEGPAGSVLAQTIRSGLPSGPEDPLMRLFFEYDVVAEDSAVHDRLVQAMYAGQVELYRRVLERGVASGEFSPTVHVDTLAMNLVVLEDAYGLHIVAGNDRITVDSAYEAMCALAEGLGLPVQRDSAEA